MVGAPPSKTAVNRAGRVLRSWQLGEMLDPDAYLGAMDVLFAFRAAHQDPLTKATMGLRSMVVTARCPRIEVSQRLKRVPTILDKLVRYPEMELARMQDIGGCRAVVDTVEEVHRVERRVARAHTKRTGSPPRTSDYIAEPKPSGYRGVHVIVNYDGRAIEVQLRTQVMHEWAIAVEQLSGRVGEDLKSSAGPRELLDWLEAASEAMALEEGGGVVDQGRLDRLNALRLRAVAWLQEARRP